jgi:hypothetical protein
MNLNKTNLFSAIFLVAMFVPLLAISQVSEEKSLSKAIRLFDNRNYEEAELLFNEILKEQPEDFMVNYFYGACRTENNHFTNFDLECLIKANKEVSPINIHYYFGTQYHARSNWNRALKYYNKYNSIAALSDDEKQKLLEKIQQCYDKINPYEEYLLDEIDENDNVSSATISSTNADSISENENVLMDSVVENEASIIIKIPVITNKVIEEKLPLGEAIVFVVNDDITYFYTSHFKTKNGKDFFMKGNSMQEELDLTLNKVDELRMNYSNAKTREEKNSVGKEILSLETDSYSLKKEVSDFSSKAKTTESEYWESTTPAEYEKFIQELNQISEQEKNTYNADKETNTDSTTLIDPNILLGENAIVLSTEKSENNDLIYKIQIGAYSRGLPNYIKRQFDKLSLIRKIDNYTDENGIVVYTTGNLTNYEDAVKMQNRVRQEGIEDAYVVPYFKRKRITLGQAKELDSNR